MSPETKLKLKSWLNNTKLAAGAMVRVPSAWVVILIYTLGVLAIGAILS